MAAISARPFAPRDLRVSNKGCPRRRPGKERIFPGLWTPTYQRGGIQIPHLHPDDDWPVVVVNLRKSRKKWALMYSTIGREG